MEYLTSKDIAGILKLSDNTIKKLMKSGELPARQIAGKWVTTKKLFDEYIEAGNYSTLRIR